MSGVSPSTPINVSHEHVCHSEISVISLSTPLHLTGRHQSLCEIGMDVLREAHLWLPHYIASVLVKPRPVRNLPPRPPLKQSGCFYRQTQWKFCSYYKDDNVLGVWAWPLLPNGRQSVCIVAHVYAHEPQRKLPAMRSLAWQPEAFRPVTNTYEFTKTIQNTNYIYHNFKCKHLNGRMNFISKWKRPLVVKRGVRKTPKMWHAEINVSAWDWTYAKEPAQLEARGLTLGPPPPPPQLDSPALSKRAHPWKAEPPPRRRHAVPSCVYNLRQVIITVIHHCTWEADHLNLPAAASQAPLLYWRASLKRGEIVRV